MLATQWPWFWFAKSVDTDEARKSGFAGITATAYGVYHVWSKRQEKKKRQAVEHDCQHWRRTVARIENEAETSSPEVKQKTRQLIGSRSALAEEMQHQNSIKDQV